MSKQSLNRDTNPEIEESKYKKVTLKVRSSGREYRPTLKYCCSNKYLTAFQKRLGVLIRHFLLENESDTIGLNLTP